MVRRIIFIAAMLVFAGCNKDSGGSSKDSGDAADDAVDNTDSGDPTKTGDVIISTATMADLELSKAIGFSVPPAVVATGDGVSVGATGKVEISTALTASERKLSASSCQTRRRVKAVMRDIRGIARDLCYIENDAGQIAFDKKYKIEFGDGDSKSIWIDYSDKGNIQVSFCNKDQLGHVFRVTGNKDKRSAGSFKSIENFPESKEYVDGRYDNGFTDEGIVRSHVVKKVVDTVGGSEKVDTVSLKLGGTEPSLVRATEWNKYKHEVSGQFTTNFVSVFAVIGKHLGSALIYFGGDQDGDGTPDSEATGFRSFFDSAGRLLKKEASALFGTGSTVHVGADRLSSALGEGYVSGPFDGSAWDCSGTETITPSGTNEQYGVCDALTAGFDDEDCSLSDYSDEADEGLSPAELADYGKGSDPSGLQ